MGGGSGGGGRGGRKGGGGGPEPTPQQIGNAQRKVAGIVEAVLVNSWAGKLTSYQANSLNFLSSQAGRKTPMTEKQSKWLSSLAKTAAEKQPALKKNYLSPNVLKKVGL